MDKSTQKLISPLIRLHKMSGRWKVSELTAILKGLEEFDIAVGKKRKITLAAAIIFLIAGFGPVLWGIIYLLPLAAAGIVCIFLNRRYKNFDVDDEVRTFINPLIDMLKDDIKKESHVSVELNLLPFEGKTFLKEKSKKYSEGAYHKCYDYKYERDFFKIKMSLADGNKVSFSMSDSMVKTEKTKSNARGKTKTKNKFSRKSEFGIDLLIDEQHFAIAHPDKLKAMNVSVSKKESRTEISGEFPIKKKSEGNASSLAADPAAALVKLISLYAALKPVNSK